MIRNRIKNTLSNLFENGSTMNLLICLMWASEFSLVYINGILNKLPFIRDIKEPLLYIGLIIIIIGSLPQFLKRLHYLDYIFYFACIILYFMQFTLYPQNSQVLSEYMFMCVISAMPCYFLGKSMNIQRILHSLYMFSLLSIAMDVFYFLIYGHMTIGQHLQDLEMYHMHKAYALVPHIMLVFWFAMQKTNKWNITFLIIGCLLLLSYGTRGPMLSLLAFILIYILFYTNNRKTKTFTILIVLVSSALIYFAPNLILYLTQLIENWGLSTRIVEKFIEGEIFDDSGRDNIKTMLLNLMERNPTNHNGYGILGSYFYIGTYPHNIVLDFIFSFGYYIGGVLLLILLYIFIKGVKSAQTNDEKLFAILLLSAIIIKLFFSSTFIRESLFYMAIGYCTQLIRNRHYCLNKK